MLGGSGGSPRSCMSPGHTTQASVELKKCQSVSSGPRARAGRRTCLFDLPGVSLVGAGNIVCQRLRAGEVMVRAWGGDNVALSGDLTGETGDWAGDLVDLAEEEDTGKTARWALASDLREIGTYGLVRMTKPKPHGRQIHKVIDTRGRAHAYALGY